MKANPPTPSSTSTAPTAASPTAATRRANHGPSRPYKRGKVWYVRRNYRGHAINISGCRTEAQARSELNRRIREIDDNKRPAGLGAQRTSVAQALQDFAMQRLPRLKGADQDARRINVYLRAAGLSLLKVTPLPLGAKDVESNPAAKSGRGAYCKVELIEHTTARRIPNGLHRHRAVLETANADTNRLRAVLATTTMADVTRQQIQDLVDAMDTEHSAAATVEQERALLRRLFNHAHTKWAWSELLDNPATKLDMPTVDNDRSRVLSYQEQELLDQALAICRNELVAPTVTLMTETALRASEPIDNATWKDVNWDSRLLRVKDAKTGSRDVPLSPRAITALKELQRLSGGQDDQRIVAISYNSLSAAWRRALKRAGIEDLHLQDLRHTAATRMALKTGNVFLVKALTGHRTLKMVERYVNVKAEDVVKVMHQTDVATDDAAASRTGTAGRSTDQEVLVGTAEPAKPVASEDSQAPALHVAAGATNSNVVEFPKRLRA